MTDSTMWREQYRRLRARILSFTPVVRRRRHERKVAHLTELLRRSNRDLERERGLKEQIASLFLARPTLAATARFATQAPLVSTATEELCLFVTHAADADLKPHALDHVEALLDAGISVVLIANTDLDFSSVRIPAELRCRLHGCIVRENVGYDFGAWAHAYRLIDPRAIRSRLYLINDSIIGPLDRGSYRSLLERVRGSTADFVGLTCNPEPRPHLQSYFLAINERLLRAAVFDDFFRNVVNFPRKIDAIECYEVWLTCFMERVGFAYASMFPALRIDSEFRDDTLWGWRQLIDLGFPFIKSSVLSHSPTADEARRLLPARYSTPELPASRAVHSILADDVRC